MQRIKDQCGDVLVDIYCTDEFFGDSSLIGSPDINEKAVALEDKTTLMVWTGAVVEDFMMRHIDLLITVGEKLRRSFVERGARR